MSEYFKSEYEKELEARLNIEVFDEFADNINVSAVDVGMSAGGTVSIYTAFAAYITLRGTTPTDLYFSAGTYKLDTNITVPSNFNIIMANGAKFSGVLGTETLTLNCKFDAGPYQVFDNLVVAGTPIIEKGYAQWFGAVNTVTTDDAIPLQKAINFVPELDLLGLDYSTTVKLTLKENFKLTNGNLVTTASITNVIYAYNCDNITIENVNANGSDIAENGIFIWLGDNIIVKNCYCHNFTSISLNTVGIYLKACNFSEVKQCKMTNIVRTLLAARGLLLEKCSHTIVEQCEVDTITGADDADGIHILGEDYSLTDIESNAFVVVRDCKVNDCSKRSIKIQQSGVVCENNEFTSTISQSYAVAIYASNIKVINNKIEVDTVEPIGIGNTLVDIEKNVLIQNNYVKWTNTSSQAAVTINTSKYVENVTIVGNTFVAPVGLVDSGIAIRTYVKGIKIFANRFVNVVNAVYIRDISAITPLNGKDIREDVIIANNSGTVKYNIVYEEGGKITTGLLIANNQFTIIAPLSYASNSVRLTAASYANGAIVDNNKSNPDFPDGSPHKSNSSFQTLYEVFDDFSYQTLTEADTPWILNKGNDGVALDPVILIDERGKIVLTTGSSSTLTVSANGSQIVCAIPMQADSGGLAGEARLHINSAITGVSINAGFTDSTSLEEPFTIATDDVITAVADNAACFVYDDSATTKTWFACSVDTTVQDTGNGKVGDLVIEDCEDVWTAKTNVTAAVDAGDKKVGTNSCTFAVTDAFTTGIIATEVITSVDLTSYTHISFWFKSDVALDASDYQFLIDDTAVCVSPLCTLNLPAVLANTWTFCQIALTNPTYLTSVISLGLSQAVDKGAINVKIDDVRVYNNSSYIVNTNDRLVEDCEDAWNEQVVANVTSSLDNTDFITGTGSAKFVVDAAFGTGIIGTEAFTTFDMRGYRFAKFWLKSSVALAVGDYQLLIDNTALCASPTETINLPAIPANTWTLCKLPFATPSNLVTPISVGLSQAVDVGAVTINIDEVVVYNNPTYAPVAGTYQRLRVEVSSDGTSIYFYIDGRLVKTLSNVGVAASTNLYFTVVANSTATASKTVDVDNLYAAHLR